MMLKNSLWMSKEKANKRSATDFTMQMWENGKRRIWLFALLSFVLLLSYPMFAALRLGNYGRGTIAAMNVGHDVLGISKGVTVFFVTLGGILCAVEGFSWLHSRKKTDMYLSQPITAGRRFAITYLNGVLLYFVPYLVSLLLALLVLAGAGVCSGVLLVEVLFTVVAALVYFLAVYNLALIAVMISGKMSMTGFFVLMGFSYDIVFRTMIEGYYNSYFSTYYSQANEAAQYLSPTMRMLSTLSGVGALLHQEGLTLTAGDVLRNEILPMLSGLGILLLEAAVFGALAYYCYQKRPMEAASSAVAFPALKSPIKAVLIVLSGLLASICFCEVASSYDFFAAAPGLVIGVLFAQAVMEIIYEGDIRAFARHKVSFMVGAAAALCIYLFFALDISGYDTWVPSEKQVESAAIEIQFTNKYRIPKLDDEGEMTWDDRKSSPLYRMKLTDVSGVLSLAEDGMGKNAANLKRDTSEQEFLYCVVKYDMKNGGVKYREFFIDYEQEKTVLDILFANEEYKEGANQVLSAQMDRIFEKSRAYYNNGLQEKEIVDKDVFALMRAYQEDVRKMSFSDVKDTLPCGSLLLRYKGRDEIENTLEYPVFPSYTKTAKYLQGKDISLHLTIEPAAVDSLRFVVYNETEDAGAIVADKSFGQESTSMAETEMMELEYTERSEIEEILTCLYPYNLAGFSYTPGSYDDDIRVRLKAADRKEADFYHWSDAEFIVQRELLPEFVRKDIEGK